jgi:hypothetical protein
MRTATALQRNTDRTAAITRQPLLKRVETCAGMGAEPERHRYCCRYMELFVWLSGGEFLGFELDYALRTAEARSIRWSESEGFVFSRMQAAAGDDDRRQFLVPITDAEPPLSFVAAVFATASRNVDSHTRRYVLSKLVEAAPLSWGEQPRLIQAGSQPNESSSALKKRRKRR